MNPHLHVYCEYAELRFAQLDTYFASHNVPPVQQLHVLYCVLSSTSARSVKDRKQHIFPFYDGTPKVRNQDSDC